MDHPALEKKQTRSARQAALQYDVPEPTLRRRRKGIQFRGDKANEEETLVKWILDLDLRALPSCGGASPAAQWF